MGEYDPSLQAYLDKSSSLRLYDPGGLEEDLFVLGRGRGRGVQGRERPLDLRGTTHGFDFDRFLKSTL